ncbi:ExeA family protein [Desulfosarcina sp.]|uniref:ExeA family protein n=1 Tax=Desulfosarcina sp. TaxID=2027861 RepID=UPI003971158E
MYESHYGLTAKPFSIVPNPEILFLSKNHANALTYLEYGLSEKVGFILLTGEIGAGKTTLIRCMLNKIESQMDVAVIFNTNFTADQMLRRILSEFDIPCDTTDKERHLQLLYQFLIDRYAMGNHVLLIVDEAQNLSDDALEDIRMLSNLQTDDQILLQIMLVGQPELKNRLNLPEFRQLAQRIAVNYHITPLDADQTRDYIGYRIQKAGGKPDLFAPEAVQRIHRHSGGIPRSINLMCDTALVYGFADNLQHIELAVVEKVIKDRVCMPVGEEKPAGRKKTKGMVSGGGAGPGIMERIHSLEESLAELKQQHEKFTEKVQNDLLLKYQQLLVTEQQRFDRLMAKFSQTLQQDQPQDAIMSEKEDGKGLDGQARKRDVKTKYAQLLMMEEAKQALKKETEGREP